MDLDKETKDKILDAQLKSGWAFRKYEGPFSAGYIACFEDMKKEIKELKEEVESFHEDEAGEDL